MSETSLKSYMMFTILAMFLLMSSFYLIKGFGEAGGVTLTDNYSTVKFTNYENTIKTEKNNTETLYDESLQASPDTDSDDILGSWLTQGWDKLRDIMSSTKKFTTFSFDLLKDVADKMDIPPYILTIGLFILIIGLIIIVLAVIIERRGVM